MSVYPSNTLKCVLNEHLLLRVTLLFSCIFQLVGSAPQFPHGIIDNIVEIAKVRLQLIMNDNGFVFMQCFSISYP